MSERSYGVLLVESATGIVLNFDGSWYLNTSGEPPKATVSSIEEAFALKEELLKRFPDAEVAIVDGPTGFSPITFRAEP